MAKRNTSRSRTGPAAPLGGAAPPSGAAAPPPATADAEMCEMCERIGCTTADFAQYAERAGGQTKWTEVSTEYEQLQQRVVVSKREGREFPEGIPPIKKYLFLVHWPSLRMKHLNETATGEGESVTGAPAPAPTDQVIYLIFRQ